MLYNVYYIHSVITFYFSLIIFKRLAEVSIYLLLLLMIKHVNQMVFRVHEYYAIYYRFREHLKVKYVGFV